MDGPFVLAIDQGTTGTTAAILNHGDQAESLILAQVSVEFEQSYPKPGWVEHDLDKIWSSVQNAVELVSTKASTLSKSFVPAKISAIGITNQRETTCFIDRRSGKPLRNAIVWQCRRSQGICEDLRQQGFNDEVQAKTGLLIDPYFSGTKIAWAIRHDEDLARAFAQKEVLCGTIDSFLVYRLSGGRKFVTEASNASRTMLFDIHRGVWDAHLAESIGLASLDSLAEVKDSAGEFAHTEGLSFLPDGIPISGILGDQQAALAGQACFEAGEAKCTYGTGAFLLMQLGEHAYRSEHQLLTTVAWSLGGKRSYAFEGSAFIAGAAIQFMRDQVRFLTKAEQSAEMAREAQASPDLYFVPALCGLGAPWWEANARGAFLGLTRGTNHAQLVRAALEGINFQVCDLLNAMNKDSGQPIKSLKVDGGACSNDLLMQMQADLANLIVERPECLESTALGAGLFASLGCGIYSSLDDIKSGRLGMKSFVPAIGSTSCPLRQRKIDGWKRAVHAVTVFAGG